jgi:ankyrin repeat protein
MDVSQLHSMSRKGNLSALQQFLSQTNKKQNQGHFLNTFFEGRTALHVAATEGRSEIVSALLEVSETLIAAVFRLG